MSTNKNSITFSAIMKKLEVKSLKSMDKGGSVLFEFNINDDELISAMNRVMRADAEVMVTIQGQ